MNNQDLKFLSMPKDYTSIGMILDPKLTTKDCKQAQTPIDTTTGLLHYQVEKPLLSIGLISTCADQFCSCALLQSGIAYLHVSFTVYEYFYKLSKSASFSQWLLHPVIQKNQ